MVLKKPGKLSLVSQRKSLVFAGFKCRDMEFLFLTWAGLCGPTNPWNSQWNAKDKRFSFPFVWEGRGREKS